MVRRKSSVERRGWTRLPLHIPLFVRSRDRNGKDFLEFATALNVSAGGALVAVHGAVRPLAQVSLEIPSAPLPSAVTVRKNARNLRARVVRVTHGEGFNLIGVRFLQPLLPPETMAIPAQRKVSSPNVKVFSH
ncbi:MAG: PilZ domain-containing protein [Acidobacteria bacterium]|nr:PilZ domain-containing protein [Acidobacteriota bacterium]